MSPSISRKPAGSIEATGLYHFTSRKLAGPGTLLLASAYQKKDKPTGAGHKKAVQVDFIFSIRSIDFTFVTFKKLSLNMPVSPNCEVVARSNFRGARLLVIDDNPDHGTIIKKVVGQCLAEVESTIATNQEQAMTYLADCQPEEWSWPKLIILDLYLPDRQDGWQLLTKIKSLPLGMGKIPVIMLSHSADHNDITEAYQRGCSSYLTKPGQIEQWVEHFQMLRTYWWENVTLPRPTISLF